MNNKKIAFITCVNDEEMYEECLLYINNLAVPEGYEIDIIPIRNAKSIASGYNLAIEKTDAKYKVYLHQDTFIINKNFIKDIVDIFSQDDKFSMIGMIGSKDIPLSGLWWESQKKFGQIYNRQNGKIQMLSFGEMSNEYEEVKVIDGFIMISQYDIKWREDIFEGWHFYNISQSIEFSKKNYKVVVPNQKKCWCIHEGRLIKDDCKYKKYRDVFMEEYSKDIFPLVSVLIPTYNRPYYLEQALQSVINQTYKNIEIIIGDDSTNNDTEEIINKKYINVYLNIKYFHNVKNLGQFNNDLKLMEMANGEYINFLMDDDLFEATKIEKMMRYFINDSSNEISLITSHREIIDSKGEVKGIFANTDSLFTKDEILDGYQCGNFALINNFNYIGEPTTVLFRKSKLNELFGMFNGKKYGCNVDMATWLNLLNNGKLVFINEVLSYFRRFEGQQSCTDKMKILGAIDYSNEIIDGREKGFLNDDREFYKSIENCLKYCCMVEKEVSKDNKANLYNINQQLLNQIDVLKGYHSKEVKDFPLVSILIPAYNQTKFLKEALESAINQTYPNIEIIIGDDSTNDEVEKFILPYLKKYNNIQYFKNSPHKMDYGIMNDKLLLKRSKGEYINFLMHDDILESTKIEKMMKYYLNYENVTLVTSHRQLIDSEGKDLDDDGATKRLFDKDSFVDGIELGRLCLKNLTNHIGEFTTVLLKKELIYDNLFEFNGNEYLNLADLATWLTLSRKGRVVYIAESLSKIRRHEGQNTEKIEIYLKGIIEWKNIIYDSYEMGFINDFSEYRYLLQNWFMLWRNVSERIHNNICDENTINEIKSAYNDVIDICFDNYKINSYYNEVGCTFLKLFMKKSYKEANDYLNNYLKYGCDIYKVDTIKNCCKKNKFTYKLIEKEKLRNVYKPYFFKYGLEEKLEYKSPEIYIAELKNIRVIGGCSAILYDDYCLFDIMKQFDEADRYDYKFNGVLFNIDKEYAIVGGAKTNIVIDEAIPLLGIASNNYFHFTVETISRLQYIDKYEEYRSLPILLDECVRENPQFIELLSRLNIYKHEILYIEKEVVYSIKEAIFPSYNTWMPMNLKYGIKLKEKDQLISEDSIKYIRNMIIKSPTKGFRKIYISRQNTQIKRIDNENQVIQILKKYGFEIIYPEKLAFEEQIKIFSEAEYIMGATGAAFTNIIYAPKNAKVVSIIPKEFNGCLYPTICGILGIKTIFLDAKVVIKGPTRAVDIFNLDISYLEDFINKYIEI